MVSFQCQACGDVVKKPKLDHHHGRCHAGFDCIDCSVTFKTPAEYKSHTSCISEAEKYEKKLYAGPKNGHANGNPPAGQAGRGGVPGRGRGNIRGGPPGWGGYQGGGRGRPRYEATGANDTPLGTPPRMSPVILPADGSSESKTNKATKPVPSLAKNENETDGDGPPSSERPKKKRSKSKSEPEPKEIGIKENPSNPSQPSSSEDTPPTKKKEKKKRKKEEDGQNPVTEPPNAEAEEQGRGGGSKERRKKKKFKGDPSTGDDETDVNIKAESKGGKNTSEIPVVGSTMQADEQEKVVGSKERKKKKSKDTVPEADAAAKGDPEPKGEIKETKGRKKMRKSEKMLDEPIVPLSESVNTPLQREEPEKKSKKRRREGEGEGVKDGDVAVVDSDCKKPKKDSNVKHTSRSKELSSGKKKRKREERDEGKEVIDEPLREDVKEKKKRKNEKQG